MNSGQREKDKSAYEEYTMRAKHAKSENTAIIISYYMLRR